MSPIELLARREALGLSQGLLAARLHVAQNTVSGWERGSRAVPDGIEAELRVLEESAELIMETALEALEQFTDDGPVPVLFAYRDDREMWAAIPELDGLPAVVHRVALARALCEYGRVDIEEKPSR